MFNKNQKEFTNCIQEKVWELATRQVPLEISLPYISDNLKAACEDWHNFCRNLFADMYESPDRFGFLIDTSKQDYENKKQVEFYFWMIGWLKKLNGNEYKVPIEIFRKVMKKFNPVSVKALETHGFVFEISNEFAFVRNKIYPEMFVGANAVIEAGYANYKVNCDYFMIYCDFRAFAKYN